MNNPYREKIIFSATEDSIQNIPCEMARDIQLSDKWCFQLILTYTIATICLWAKFLDLVISIFEKG